MRKSLVVFLIAIGASGVSLAEHVTLPAAASIVGAAPFFSDVRAFNTSYTNDLTVEARYRCFIPVPCNLSVQSVTFTLTPRQSQAFNDIVVSQFNAPDTAGGIEFEYSGDSDQLVVTSRLYSTEPQPTVGMFIPALKDSDAHATTVLTSIRNGGPNAGFRTNVGVFNREDSSADLTFTIFDGGGNQVGNPVTRSVPGHSGVQVSGIFREAGDAGHVTSNAIIVVSASHEIFSYAAVIDNDTTDPIFVVGAEDLPQQPITPGAPTVTPTQQAPTPTRTPTVTPTQTTGGTRNVSVGQGGLRFVDEVSGTSTSTITVGQTVRWNWASGTHNVTSTSGGENFDSGDKSSGNFSHTFNQAGTFGYLCTIHGSIMSGTVVVNP